MSEAEAAYVEKFNRFQTQYIATGSNQISPMDDLSLGLNRKQIKDLFKHFDQDESGDISVEEFLDFVDECESTLTVEEEFERAKSKLLNN